MKHNEGRILRNLLGRMADEILRVTKNIGFREAWHGLDLALLDDLASRLRERAPRARQFPSVGFLPAAIKSRRMTVAFQHCLGEYRHLFRSGGERLYQGRVGFVEIAHQYLEHCKQ